MAENFVKKHVRKSIMKMSIISIGVMLIVITLITNYKDKINYDFIKKYCNGFKTQKITSLKDFENIDEKFNTVEYTGKDLTKTKIQKKIRRRKREEIAYYYVAKLDNKSMLILVDSRDEEKIKNGQYIVKGTLKPINSDIKKNAEIFLGKSKQVSDGVVEKYIDTFDEWKIEYGMLYSVILIIILIIILGIIFLIIRPLCYLVNKKRHPLYKQLQKGIQNEEDIDETEGYKIIIDNYYVEIDNKPFEAYDTIMVPVKESLEMIGAYVRNSSSKQDVMIIRIGKYQINISKDSNLININGEKRELKSTTVLKDSILYVPISFFSEILNQNVRIDKEKQYVYISEKDSKYTYEQLYFGYSVAAILATYNNQKLDILGGDTRCKEYCDMHRESLKEWWGITCRQDLFDMVGKLKKGLHNNIFMDIKERVQYLSDGEYKNELNKFSEPSQKRDLQVVRKYCRELGDKGIIGWDLSRVITITGGAYLAGFLQYEEANEIIMDIARKTQDTFSSLEEVWKNYLIGYEFWSGDYPEDKESNVAERWKIYDELVIDDTSPCYTLKWTMNLNSNNY